MPGAAVNYPQYYVQQSNQPLQMYLRPMMDGRRQQRLSGGYAEYPAVPVLPMVPPGVRASEHPESYHSVPFDDIQYHSRQPQLSSPQSSLTSSSLEPASSQDRMSSLSVTSSDSGPLPLNEHYSTSTDYNTHSTEGLVEQQQLPRQQQRHPYDAPIPTTDPRYTTYFHLKNLFPERSVRRVMNKYPNELDPNKITAAVLHSQSAMRPITNVAC